MSPVDALSHLWPDTGSPEPTVSHGPPGGPARLVILSPSRGAFSSEAWTLLIGGNDRRAEGTDQAGWAERPSAPSPQRRSGTPLTCGGGFWRASCVSSGPPFVVLCVSSSE